MAGKRRAYSVTHYAKTAVTVYVAATSAKEAERLERQGEGIIDDGYASEAWPVSKGRARRAPGFDELVPR